MNLSNYARYTYGFIIGMCLEYIIRVEVSIYPIVIILCMLTIMIIDLISEHRANSEYDSYYNARNNKLDNWKKD